MRTTAVVCVVALLLLSTTAFAASTGNSEPIVEKVSKPTGVPTYEGRNPGDTIEDPLVIDFIPDTLWGNTCPFNNNYDEACPYSGSTSPEVVYRYDPAYTSWVTIDLCASSYDTKVYVYENEYTPGMPLVCNDDTAGCGPNGYRSWAQAEFVYGNTYYIVVDGYTGACGEYELFIHNYMSCVYCPPDAYVETEPQCMDPVNDVHNGGCNSEPPVFDHLEPGEDVVSFCGTSGTYTVGYNNYRDTDWYQIDLAHESEIEFSCTANFLVRIGIVDGREGCEDVSEFYAYEDGYPCGVVELVETLPAGTWWLWVGPTSFTDIWCGVDYACELTGYNPVTPVEDSSWSVIKALFR